MHTVPAEDTGMSSKRLERIVRDYAEHGVPRELFETTKRQSISNQEHSRNSISALASDWATTIALKGIFPTARQDTAAETPAFVSA